MTWYKGLVEKYVGVIKMSNKSFKVIILIILVLVCLAAILAYHNRRRYITFTYITESDYTNLDYYDDYNFPDDCEFTWWWHLPAKSPDIITNIDENFGTTFKELLDNMDYTIDENKVDIIISFGRKLKTIYSDEKIYYDRGKYMLDCIPVFEKEYSPKIYLYVTDKKYDIYPAEFWGDDIVQFNRYGNVRFEEE